MKLLKILIGFPLSRNTRKERYAIFDIINYNLFLTIDKSIALYFNFKSNQGVSIGGGTGSVSDMLDSAQLICEKVSLFKVTVF
jgi:N-acetylglucosamine kinase-like BadF-type ATPase